MSPTGKLTFKTDFARRRLQFRKFQGWEFSKLLNKGGFILRLELVIIA